MTDLSGQVAIVTGGGRGIGRACVDLLAAAGAKVMACSRGTRPDDLPDTIEWRTADVSLTQDVEKLFSECGTALGPCTVLVNNAGVQVEKTVAASTDADFDMVVGINCRGVFNGCRAFLNQPDARGAIINIGSISGNISDPEMALYNASKAFVHGLTRSIAVDHGPKVRCNAVSPGWIMTEMADAAFALANDPAAAKTDALARHASNRFGEPTDVARTVLWLADPLNSFVTGQCITVDGGVTSASPLQPGLF
ncbi:MAG: SDR family oxidoreductase [Pseudomonadota bacterium]